MHAIMFALEKKEQCSCMAALALEPTADSALQQQTVMALAACVAAIDRCQLAGRAGQPRAKPASGQR